MDPAYTSQLPQTRPPRSPALAGQDALLFDKARALEASFLSEMLGHAGLNAAPDGFSGGAGEEQFSSFLRAEQAKAMVAKGGIGLAEQIFHALKERTSDAK
ncbi:MAG: rod-binding protein [Cypionkella sp.]|nr:rod-binding protein [Cypionkella sp.]